MSQNEKEARIADLAAYLEYLADCSDCTDARLSSDTRIDAYLSAQSFVYDGRVR